MNKLDCALCVCTATHSFPASIKSKWLIPLLCLWTLLSPCIKTSPPQRVSATGPHIKHVTTPHHMYVPVCCPGDRWQIEMKAGRSCTLFKCYSTSTWIQIPPMLTCWGFSSSVSSLWSLLWIKWFWSFSLKESLYLIIEAPLSCCHKYDAFSFFPQTPACGHHACMLSCGRDTGWTYKEHVHLSLPVRPSSNHSLNLCSTIYYLLETLSNLNEDVIPVSENTHLNHWSQQWGVHHFCYGVCGILLP